MKYIKGILLSTLITLTSQNAIAKDTDDHQNTKKINQFAWHQSTNAISLGDEARLKHLVQSTPEVMTYFSKDDNSTLINLILKQSQFTIDKRKSLLEVIQNEGTVYFNSNIANGMTPLQ